MNVSGPYERNVEILLEDGEDKKRSIFQKDLLFDIELVLASTRTFGSNFKACLFSWSLM